MRLLLDTHIFIWVIEDNPKLTARARAILADASEIHVSAASIWEIAIKARLGKIVANTLELADTIEASGFIELPIRARHTAGVQHLPLHHHDPFDRLLVAQAQVEALRLMTADETVALYSGSFIPRHSDFVIKV